ncbi:hypothetical protein G5I_07236 [Acromyrmex echinatior]|uniref:Uncharacterized protein n=1 Tax=Acromyrmex echinatior TaxID=103372 RepID=F4WN86_ACREC|nr:hypothetical protein G5I_07236 [Acromyrmex echinatior]
MGQSDRKISHDIGNNGGTLSDTNPFVTKLNRSVVELLRRFLEENGRFSWLVLEEEYNLRLWGQGYRERKGEKGKEGEERWKDSQKAGRNKDEGIGVGGWTIRHDHPMKPRTQSWV